ncbi:MAG: methionine--tRNA ligase subunit beta [Deltaproteobacteria bacterium]|nr:methionine--tRNA ligase subunit beta [Deltaproteobacteria bacterium]
MDIVKFEDFQRLDLRVGQIKNCEEIEGAERLYKITVDIGEERIIVAGIKPYYKKEELIGKKIVVIANLEPRKIKGILSRGMLLAAVDKKTNEVVLLTIDKNVEVGSKIS